MDPLTLNMLIPVALTVGKDVWNFISNLSAGKFPTYDDLLVQNTTLQAKIDAEKAKIGK